MLIDSPPLLGVGDALALDLPRRRVTRHRQPPHPSAPSSKNSDESSTTAPPTSSASSSPAPSSRRLRVSRDNKGPAAHRTYRAPKQDSRIDSANEHTVERSQHATAADEHDEFHSEMGRNRDGLAGRTTSGRRAWPRGKLEWQRAVSGGGSERRAVIEAPTLRQTPLTSRSTCRPTVFMGSNWSLTSSCWGEGKHRGHRRVRRRGPPWDRRVAPGRASRVAMLKTVRPGGSLPSFVRNTARTASSRCHPSRPGSIASE